MESFFSRYRNEWVLVGLLFVQLLALATQVRVPDRAAEKDLSKEFSNETRAGHPQAGSTRLIRVWAVGMMAPLQKLGSMTGHGIRGLWSDYIDLRHVRQQNDELRQELGRLRLEQARLQQDAEQGRRLQAVLDFKEQYIKKTVAAQVIGTSGTDLSRVIYIDHGTRDGIAAGMAVITADGVAGKVSRADRYIAQVLLISDPQSGAGVLLERLRLNGILKGSAGPLPEMQNVLADEKIQVGDRIITTGGDHVFPKGLPVGTVESFYPDRDRDPFLNIKVRPAVNLGRLEEVLVVTELGERGGESPAVAASRTRAADMLAERLPSAPVLTEDEQKARAAAANRQPPPVQPDRFSPQPSAAMAGKRSDAKKTEPKALEQEKQKEKKNKENIPANTGERPR